MATYHLFPGLQPWLILYPNRLQNAEAVVTPPVTVPPIIGGAGWISRPVKKKKKRDLVDELDELIAHAKSRIEDTEVYEDPLLELRRAQLSAATEKALLAGNRDTMAELGHQIGMLQRIIREIDDEEVLLLMS